LAKRSLHALPPRFDVFVMQPGEATRFDLVVALVVRCVIEDVGDERVAIAHCFGRFSGFDGRYGALSRGAWGGITDMVCRSATPTDSPSDPLPDLYARVTGEAMSTVRFCVEVWQE